MFTLTQQGMIEHHVGTLLIKMMGYLSKVNASTGGSSSPETQNKIIDILNKIYEDEFSTIFPYEYNEATNSNKISLREAMEKKVIPHELWGILHADYNVLSSLHIINSVREVNDSAAYITTTDMPMIGPRISTFAIKSLEDFISKNNMLAQHRSELKYFQELPEQTQNEQQQKHIPTK